MHRVWLVVALVGCYRSSAPTTSAPQAPAAPRVLVYRGATLVDLAATPDGRVAALVCTHGGMSVARWDAAGKLAVDQAVGKTCERGRLAIAGDDDVIVADTLCGGSTRAELEGCVRVRRFDPGAANPRWTLMPKLSVLFTFTLSDAGELAVGGWRMKPNVQDPTVTDVHVVAADGSIRRSHELLAVRTDLAEVAFVGDDLLATGFVDPDRTNNSFTIDGTAHTIARGRPIFVTRLGATRWLAVLAELDVELYMPPALVVPDRGRAVVVATARARDGASIPLVGYSGTGTVALTLGVDLATGKVSGGRYHEANPFQQQITDVVLTADRIATTETIKRDVVRERGGGCKGEEPCRYGNGPEAYGHTSIPQVSSINPRTLELDGAMTRHRGHAYVTDAKLAYASKSRALFLAGTFAGTLKLGKNTLVTEQHREEPCKDDQSSTGAPRFILATSPMRDPCTVVVSYASAVFVARLD